MTTRAILLLAALTFTAVPAMRAQSGGAPMVSGRVFDDTTGCPLRGVSLTAVGSAAKTMTDANGRYYLKGIPATPFTLQAFLAGYQTQSTENLVVTDSAGRVDFSLLRAVAATTKSKVRYPSMKCILDRKDSGGRYDRR